MKLLSCNRRLGLTDQGGGLRWTPLSPFFSTANDIIS